MARTPFTERALFQLSHQGSTSKQGSDKQMWQQMTLLQLGVSTFTALHQNTDILSSIHYEHLSDPMIEYSHSAMDSLWKISLVLSVDRPLWSGFMQMVHQGDHPQPSSVMFLPIIDLDPNDPTCIYSTLNYVCNHASFLIHITEEAVTMDTNSTIKIQDEYVHVDPQLLFQRLLTVGTNNGELQNVLDHELCHYPPTLFESVNAIRTTTKSSLADALWCFEAENLSGPSKTVQYVLYGGALLHRIPWTRGATYDQIFEQYSAYVIRKYGRAIAVIDGYIDKSSTKDCAHIRRSGGTIGVTVHFTSSMAVQTKKEEFLSNKHNKQRFTALLSQRLEQTGCEIHQARGDADIIIVETELTSAAKQETVLVGDDTYLLVLLIYHAKNVRHNVFFRPETRRARQKGNRCWNIPAMLSLLGNVVTNNIMFLHAILGCDTTSGVYGLGKKLSISKIKSESQFQDQAMVFMSQWANNDVIISTGETALDCLYNRNPHHGINVLRYEKFCVKTATSTVPVQPGALPPTSVQSNNTSLEYTTRSRNG